MSKLRQILPDAADATAELPCLSRREAVRRVGGWVIYVGVLGATANCGPATPAALPAGGIDTGLDAASLPPNSVAYNATGIFFVCNDASGATGGFYAMTSICTHAGCNIDTSGGSPFPFEADDLSEGFHCGCHGSSYSANGAVTGGPAPAPLVHYLVTIGGNGDIFVDIGTQVDATVRVSDPSA